MIDCLKCTKWHRKRNDMSISVIEKRIRETEIFKDCSDGAMAIAESGELIEFTTGDIVCEKHASMLGIVVSGRFDIKNSDGSGVLMNTVRAGGVFGAASVFCGGNDVSEIKAMTKSKVLFLSNEKLCAIFESDSAVAVRYLRFLSERIEFLNKKIVSFTAARADSAMAGYILDASCGKDEIKLNCSAAAKRLGIGRTTVYRALRELEEDGAIKSCDGMIKITNAERLKTKRRKQS